MKSFVLSLVFVLQSKPLSRALLALNLLNLTILICILTNLHVVKLYTAFKLVLHEQNVHESYIPSSSCFQPQLLHDFLPAYPATPSALSVSFLSVFVYVSGCFESTQNRPLKLHGKGDAKFQKNKVFIIIIKNFISHVY